MPWRASRSTASSAPGSRKSLNQTSWLPRASGRGGGSASLAGANSARPMRVSATREAAGPPSMPRRPTRSPPRTRSEASARTRRSDLPRLETASERKLIPGEASRQNHTVCAASHSRSRTKICLERAD